MQIASQQWTRAAVPAQPAGASAFAAEPSHHRSLYRALLSPCADASAREAGRALLQRAACAAGDDLPEDAEDLGCWMEATARTANAKYRIYLQQRHDGAPRRYFANRAHALHFLRNVAPTKLVDGAWLHGVLHGRGDARRNDLVRTYVDELGAGSPHHNHVLLYRRLMHTLDLQVDALLPDDRYEQGAVQLALARNPGCLPEIVGFNLGYEQLPLHLLITAYELDELGIDPYYFTLHVTVDNASTGHARRAVQAVQACMPQLGDRAGWWRRVRDGFRASNAGTGTEAVIAGFDIDAEVLRILRDKSGAGNGAHSDHCRIAGRGINDWLADSTQMPELLRAFEAAGWIRRNARAQESRFWKLVQGDRAPMFGVFDGYELQVIHDWLRGDASRDGACWKQMEKAPPGAAIRVLPHRILARRSVAANDAGPPLPHSDLETQALRSELRQATDAGVRDELLIRAMDPSMHWTPAGLYATRLFAASL